ncbi:hypothetical protein GCM10010284_34690 [Streptomyces rubiginosohelvolus]|uniref:glutaminase n=1 Tax=Streptomyces rubiginosohelvolus TaxID=67362 RepID=A0ABQ3BIN4_9ACTN|nr:hypothetical protein GCM10010284_34690 [Streptomyces rubiginosohelvolus]GGZ45573.1 hypothetical protein GCM10010328_20120 [Streptomyces pluricolorescens]
MYGAGDIDTEFTIQSISKPLAYALALADRGFAPVLAKVGAEPSGEAFNEISLESDTGRPRNPMINVGAITVHSLAGPEGLNATERKRVVDGLSDFAGRRLRTDDAVYASEMKHAHRNLAIAHMLRRRHPRRGRAGRRRRLYAPVFRARQHTRSGHVGRHVGEPRDEPSLGRTGGAGTGGAPGAERHVQLRNV